MPFPFQYNIRRLPPEDVTRCVEGLRAAQRQDRGTPANFRDWIMAHFGRGIAELFMLPYNRKLWARDIWKICPLIF